jgi:hypothetical protein
MASNARCKHALLAKSIKYSNQFATGILHRRLSNVGSMEKIIKTVPIDDLEEDDSSSRIESPALMKRERFRSSTMINRSISMLANSFHPYRKIPIQFCGDPKLVQLLSMCDDVEKRGLDIDRLYIIGAPTNTAEDFLRQLKGIFYI